MMIFSVLFLLLLLPFCPTLASNSISIVFSALLSAPPSSTSTSNLQYTTKELLKQKGIMPEKYFNIAHSNQKLTSSQSDSRDSYIKATSSHTMSLKNARSIKCLTGLRSIRRFVVSFCLILTLSQSISTSVYATGLNSLAGIQRASESVDYILENIENKEDKDSKNNKIKNKDTNKLFNEIDFIIKQGYLKERLQIAIAETPYEYRVCAEPLSINIMSNLYTLVEYYSVSNDQISKRMMIADAYPGEKLKFLKQGLKAVKNDLNNFFFCYPKSLKGDGTGG